LIRLTGAGAGEGLAALLDAPSDEQVRGPTPLDVADRK